MPADDHVTGAVFRRDRCLCCWRLLHRHLVVQPVLSETEDGQLPVIKCLILP